MRWDTIFKKQLFTSSVVLLASFVFCSTGYAGKLSDLIKQKPQLFLPSQITPGQAAVFTVKAKAGKNVKLILSSYSSGAQLPNGQPLRVGRTTIEEQGQIPTSGVLQISMPIPQDDSGDLLGDRQYVEAVVWSAPDQSDIAEVQFVEPSGMTTEKNLVMVVDPPDPGNTLVIPGGDPSITNLMRTMSQISDTKGDERKKDLLDAGSINRNRAMDQNLNNNGR